MKAVKAEEIQELNRLGQDQVEAARIGDSEGLLIVLERRRRLMEGLRGRAIGPQELCRLSACDQETHLLVEARIRQVEAALARIRDGGRALGRYVTRFQGLPGFIDHVR
jgi:hypothetical protein